jgi:hypothetical protein
MGSALALLGLAIPGRLGPVYRVWMRGAHAISRVTTPLFLGIVYLLVITPSGLLMRLLGRNPMRHKLTDDGYWIRRDSEKTGDLDRQF